MAVSRIFLDLDGPLLDGRLRHYFCYRSILERHGFEPLDLSQYWDGKINRMNRRELLDLSGAGSIYDQFLEEWLELIETPDALALDLLQDGALDCLNQWKQQDIELILVTLRNNRTALDEQLARAGLTSLLDSVMVCDHVSGGSGKAKAARSLSSRESLLDRTLWIGDTEVDWQASRELGCPVILVSNGLRSKEYLLTLGGAVVLPSIASMKNKRLEDIHGTSGL